MPEAPLPFVSRGGLKLRHALDVFSAAPHNFEVASLVCADFGCSTGGFTDCLLQAGASRVYAIDTAYGELAWKLRNDPRVVVMERTNCLHARVPSDVRLTGGVDLIVADAGWTPQRLLIPAALTWLKPGGRMISLVKPHYEAKDAGDAIPPRGILPDEVAEAVTQRVVASLPALGARVLGLTKSPVLGGAKGKGNAEWLVLLQRPG